MRNRKLTPHPPQAVPLPLEGEGLRTDVQEIVSAQVLFPDRKTLDEVCAELLKRIERLENTGTAVSESSESE